MSTTSLKLYSPISRYGGAVVAVALATVLRLMLDPALESRLPLTAYFIAVILVASYFGFGPALLTVALGAMLGDYLFIAPRNSLAISDASTALQLIAFCALSSGVSYLIRYIQRARRRAEESALALAENRERLAAILSNIGDAVIATDADGRVTFMNEVAESLTRSNQTEAAGKQIQELFNILDEESRVAAESPVARVLRDGGGEGSRRQALLVANDGTEILIEDNSSPIKDDMGKPAGVVLVFRDITQRKLAEQALRETEARFRTMADTAPVMLWLSDSDGLRTFVNQRWLEFTGRTIEQETGYGWADNVHPGDLQRCLETYTSSLKARRSFSVEYRLRRFDEEYRWLLDNGIPRFTNESEFIGFAGSCVDIAERKQVEEASYFLASIVESSEEGIIGKTLDGTIVSWNAAAQRIYGYTAEEVRGEHIRMLSPAERQNELDYIFETLRRGESLPHLETTRRTKDGRLIDVVLTISPIHDEAGRVTGASTIARDITDRKRVEEESRLLAAQIETERQRLNNIIANVPGVVWEAWGQPDRTTQRIDFVSEHVEKMLGYSVDQWLSTPQLLALYRAPRRQGTRRRGSIRGLCRRQGRHQPLQVGGKRSSGSMGRDAVGGGLR